MLQMKAMTDSDGFVLKPGGTELFLVLWKLCFPPGEAGWAAHTFRRFCITVKQSSFCWFYSSEAGQGSCASLGAAVHREA